MTTPTQTSPHEHVFRFYGMVNLFRGSEAVGVVDVWRCAICHVKGTELRVQGLDNLATEAGFRQLDGQDTRWIVFVCGAEEAPKFDLLLVHPGEEISHDCVEKEYPIKVSRDFAAEAKSDRYHRIVNIDNYINDVIQLSFSN